MRKRNNAIPTVTQAAELEPAGPGREDLFARANELFSVRGGRARLRAIAVLEKTVAMYDAGLDARTKDSAAPMTVGVREGLRAALAIDKAYAAVDALRETCFEQAREDIYRTTKRRVAEQVWQFDANIPPEVETHNVKRSARQVLKDELDAVQEVTRRSRAELEQAKAQVNPAAKPKAVPEPAAKDVSNLMAQLNFKTSMIQPPSGNGKHAVTQP